MDHSPVETVSQLKNLSICLYQSVHWSIVMSVCLFFFSLSSWSSCLWELSIYLAINPSICLSIYLYVYPFIVYPSLTAQPILIYLHSFCLSKQLDCCHDNSTAGIRDYLVLQAHTAVGTEVSMGTVFQVHTSSYQDLRQRLFRCSESVTTVTHWFSGWTHLLLFITEWAHVICLCTFLCLLLFINDIDHTSTNLNTLLLHEVLFNTL